LKDNKKVPYANAGIVIVLLRIKDSSKQIEETSRLPAERMFGAIRTGLRYVRNSPSIYGVFVRATVFAVSSSALPAYFHDYRVLH
jgi:hypothetical protein